MAHHRGNKEPQTPWCSTTALATRQPQGNAGTQAAMSNDDSTSVLRKGPGVPWCGSGPIEKAATEKMAAAAVEAAEQAAAMQAEQAASIAEGSHRHTCDGTSGQKNFSFFRFTKIGSRTTPGA